jgi:signal transduction histidine kinase
MDAIPLRAEPTNLEALLHGAMEALESQASQQEITLRVEAPENLPLVVVDPEKIAWAVATLVGNALRYVRRGTRHLPGGTILVRVAREADEGVSITVDDDGPGIPPEKRAHLFARAPGTTHAVGLALMLVLDVVTAHGGTIEVATETQGQARGTRITLRLPRAISVTHGGAAEP